MDSPLSRSEDYGDAIMEVENESDSENSSFDSDELPELVSIRDDSSSSDSSDTDSDSEPMLQLTVEIEGLDGIKTGIFSQS